MIISGAVEGDLDEAVLRRTVRHVGGETGTVYGKSGKAYLRQKITGFNVAAQFSPWIVIVDLDHEQECAPPLRSAWLPQSAPKMCFRVAVREVESWLMADSERLARWLHIRASEVPDDPEALDNPKEKLVELARRSRNRDVRVDMIPRPGSGRSVGPAYSSRMIDFVSDERRGWRPDVASARSDSLNRYLNRLGEFARSE